MNNTNRFRHCASFRELSIGYEMWMADYFNDGWALYLFSLLFDHLPGSYSTKIKTMHREVEWLYGKLVTRLVRKPHSRMARNILPRGIFAPDIGGTGRRDSPSALRNVRINEGLHFHGIMAVHPKSRMKEPLDCYFRDMQHHYTGDLIRQIDVQPITYNPSGTTGYAIKALRRSEFGSDEVLILPRTSSELRDFHQRNGDA